MSSNGLNTTEDADMMDCDGEKVVTMMDVLQEQEEFEEDANAVLGASDDKNCTYTKGYIKRQAIYACLTCCPEIKTDSSQRAGVCLACSLNCHENHELIELYTKRNFRCDCGNPKFNSHPCQYVSDKCDLNEENSYNQNFSGLYCVCHRPYPDPECTIEDEMIQCIVCEDWLHASHLEATLPANEQYSEMICKECMEKNEFLHDYSDLAVNNEIDQVDVVNVSSIEEASLQETNECISQEQLLSNGSMSSEADTNLPENNVTKTDIHKDISENMESTNAESSATDVNTENVTEKNRLNGETVENEIVSEEAESKTTDELVKPQPSKATSSADNDMLENSINETDLKNTQTDAKENLAETEEIDNRERTSEQKGMSNEATEQLPADEIMVTTSNIATTHTLQESELITASNQTKESLDEENKDEVINSAVDNDKDEVINSAVEDKDEAINNTVDKDKDEVINSTIEDKDEAINNTVDKNKDEVINSAVEDKDEAINNTVDKNKDEDINSTIDEYKDEVINSTVDENKNSVEELNNDTEPKECKTGEDINKKDGELNSAFTDNIEIENNENLTENTNIEMETVTNDLNKESDNTENQSEDIQNDIAMNVDKDTSDTNNKEDDGETDKEQIYSKSSLIKPDHSEDSDTKISAQDNKRKHSTENSDSEELNAKKLKFDESSTCKRPKCVKKKFRGATFWPSNFRQKLCTCNVCISMYKDLSVLFLIDPEDTVMAYEILGKEKIGSAGSQYEKGLEALSSLDRIQQINALTEYNKMRDKLLDFLKSFMDRKEIVKEEDVKAFFVRMKLKREPDGVYFCR